MRTSYPVSIVPDGDGFFISFRDVPEALSQAETLEAAKELAPYVLIDALSFYSEDGRPFPTPSDPVGDELVVPLYYPFHK